MKCERFSKIAGLSLVACLCVCLCACDDLIEEKIPEEGRTVTLTLSDSEATETSVENAVDTKTQLVNGSEVHWQSGDKIVVNRKVYSLTVDPDDPSVAYVENVVQADSYYALYVQTDDDNNAEYVYSDGQYLGWLPVQQYYSRNSFDQWVNPMAAYSEDVNLRFHNIGGIVKIGLIGNGERMKSLKLTVDGQTYIGGVFSLMESDMSSGLWDNAKFGLTDYNKFTYILQDCSNADVVLSSEPVWFHFVTAPFTLTSGAVTLIAEDYDGGVFYKQRIASAANPFSVSRSEITGLSPIAFDKLLPLTVPSVEPDVDCLNLDVKGQPGMLVKYLAVESSTYSKYVDVGYEADRLIEAWGTDVTTLSEDGTGDVWITQARNMAGKSSMTAETSYKVILRYVLDDGISGIGGCTVVDAATSAATGVAPSLEVSATNVSAEELSVNVTSDGADVRLVLLLKSMYESLVADKTDSDIVKEYGTSLNDNQLAEANSTGFTATWRSVKLNADYVFLAGAYSSSGAGIVKKLELTTPGYFFDPYNAQLELVSKSTAVTTDVFQYIGILSGDVTVTNKTLYKDVDQDVFVIPDMLKGSVELRAAGFADKEYQCLSIIDAREHDAVDMHYYVNDFGITRPNYSFFSDFRFGSWFSFNGTRPKVGTYDVENRTINVSNILLMDPSGSKYYGISGTVTIRWTDESKDNGLTTEDFSKVVEEW